MGEAEERLVANRIYRSLWQETAEKNAKNIRLSFVDAHQEDGGETASNLGKHTQKNFSSCSCCNETIIRPLLAKI